MKAMPMIANIELGTTGVVVFVNAHVLGTVKWLVVDASGKILGFSKEPKYTRGRWVVGHNTPIYLGSVELEEGDDYRGMKWEVLFTDASSSTAASE